MDDKINNEFQVKLNKSPLDINFIEWFVGLCEAEANFLCRIRKNLKGDIIGFEFLFRISLHKDDIKVLEFIKSTLNCGRIDTSRNTFVYVISQLNEIETILIPLFQQFPLNTTKYLDFLAFKKAYYLYKSRKSNEFKQDLYLQIIKIKDSMNDKRVNFDLPKNHTINITGNYLIGLLEGDGSFYLNKHDMSPRISLVTTKINKIVLEKIREFLINQLDEYSYILAANTKLINISDKKVKENYKPISILEISQIDYLCNILIPYFDTLLFRTKKYKDYKDFRLIAFLILEGKHLTEKGKNIIKNLGDIMNNNRLSSNENPIILDENTKSELDLLIKSEPLINIDSEGRAMIIYNKKYIRSTYIIKAIFFNGSVKYFVNGISCAKALNVSNNIISQRLNDGKPVKNKEGLQVAQIIKRIKVYNKLSK